MSLNGSRRYDTSPNANSRSENDRSPRALAEALSTCFLPSDSPRKYVASALKTNFVAGSYFVFAEKLRFLVSGFPLVIARPAPMLPDHCGGGGAWPWSTFEINTIETGSRILVPRIRFPLGRPGKQVSSPPQGAPGTTRAR